MGVNSMTSESQYRRFAVACLNSTEGVTDLSNKVGRLIMAEAWFDLVEQTTQRVDNDGGEAHRIIEQPLKRAGVHGHSD
jgi:hypothetical protein